MTFDPRALGARCDECPLNSNTPVPPAKAKGNRPRLIIVGEGPGRLEVNRLTPFVGPSGRLLDGVLNEAGFDRIHAHITNVILCRQDEDVELKRAVPCCAPRLAVELAALDPSIPILALGAQASKVLLGKPGIMKTRGFVWRAPEIKPSQIKSAERAVVNAEAATGRLAAFRLTKTQDSLALLQARQQLARRVVFPAVHPAFILRGADGWLPTLRIDVRRAVRWSHKPFALEDEGPFIATKDPKKAAKVLKQMSQTVVVDIETDGADPLRCKMTCVGICDVEDISKALVIDPWIPRKHTTVLKKALKGRTVVLHNGPQFDEIVLGRSGITYTKREDTLIAHFGFCSHLPKSLSHVGSVYTSSAPWKIKFKQGNEEKGIAGFGVSRDQLASYNRADVAITALSWVRMQADLTPERRVYDLDMRMADLYRRMQLSGILIDQPRRAELSRKLKWRAAALIGEMRQLLGRRNFHPAKLIDIRKALFGQLKAPTWLAPPTPTGLPACNAHVLEALKTGDNRAAKLADYIIRWRSANDVRAEYLDNLQPHKDGRVHAGWRLGVETGRPSTRKPNLLNAPRIAYCTGCGVALIDGCHHKPTCKKMLDPQPEEQVRDIFIAKPGHALLYFDESQAEMRMASNLSGDENFIAACQADVHAGNAMVIFAEVPGAVDMLRSDPKGKGKKYRDIAKNCGFAIVYLAEADKLYVHLLEHGFDVSMKVCQDIIDRIHSSYSRYFQYVDENLALCRRQGYLRSAFLGRKRWMGYYPKPTTVSNFPIQSGVADITNDRLLEIDRIKPKRVRQLIYQYDSAVYEVPLKDIEAMKKVIEDVWAEPIVVPHNGREFMQPIDMKVGTRLSQFG